MAQHSKDNSDYNPGIISNLKCFNYFLFLISGKISEKKPDKENSNTEEEGESKNNKYVFFQTYLTILLC